MESVMSYSVKEIFTLQGEGAQAGRPAVFCAFWLQSLVRPRKTAPLRNAHFATPILLARTDKMAANSPCWTVLADAIAGWPEDPIGPDAYVVFTGGEPCLQLTRPQALKARDFECCRNQWHARCAAGSRLDLRQPQAAIRPQANARP